jgi:site-specific recombinase XerD
MEALWQGVACSVGIEGIRLHSLRHGFASLLLAQGEHPKIVQNILGHFSVAITMDTYSHVQPVLKDAPINQLRRGSRAPTITSN